MSNESMLTAEQRARYEEIKKLMGEFTPAIANMIGVLLAQYSPGFMQHAKDPRMYEGFLVAHGNAKQEFDKLRAFLNKEITSYLEIVDPDNDGREQL